jgi:hypothetical protein
MVHLLARKYTIMTGIFRRRNFDLLYHNGRNKIITPPVDFGTFLGKAVKLFPYGYSLPDLSRNHQDPP